MLLFSDTMPRSDGLLAAVIEAVTWLLPAMLLFAIPYYVMVILFVFIYYTAKDVAVAIGEMFFPG